MWAGGPGMKIEFTFDKGVAVLIAIGALSILLNAFLFHDSTVILVAAGLMIAVMLIAVALFSKRKAPPSTAGAAIKTIAGLAAAFPGWAPPATKVLGKLMPAVGQASPVSAQGQIVPLAVFVVASAAICVIAVFAQRPPLDPAKPSGAGPFRERGYQERLLRVAKALPDRLDRLDFQASWTEKSFEPLDAEVEEILRDGRRQKKISDLLSAIKRDRKTRVFMIIGEPGSGKSTALRKLAKDLLASTKRTGVVSLYVNLKEWKDSIREEGNSLTTEDLYEFVLGSIRAYEDIEIAEFFEKYLRDMIDYGRIFFIFDSFDEIPALLDEDETSDLIEHITGLVSNVLSGASDSRGVVASRPYRQPRGIARAYKHLAVRPFSETQIRSALSRDPEIPPAKINEFMRGPQRWIASARNPFVASLICQYLRDPQRGVPPSQIALYENYIDERIGKFERQLIEKRLSVDDVKNAASGIADFMFSTSGLGLEVGYADLTAAKLNFELDNSVALLVRAKIMREGPLPERAISFVHRRFYEFFLVQHLRVQKTIDLSAIEQDRRERDALVLYAETADDKRASEIVAHCWQFIAAAWMREPDSPEPDGNVIRRATYGLRFLVDAFSRTGSPSLEAIHDELKAILLAHVRNTYVQPVAAKISVEASGLFSDADSAELIVRALEVGEPWISETAIRSCRYIASDNPDVKRGAERFIAQAPTSLIKKSFKDLSSIFDISDVLRSLKPILYLRIIHINIRLFLWAAIIFVCPTAASMRLVTLIEDKGEGRRLNIAYKYEILRGEMIQLLMMIGILFIVARPSSMYISNQNNIATTFVFPSYYAIKTILPSYDIGAACAVIIILSILLARFNAIWAIFMWSREICNMILSFDIKEVRFSHLISLFIAAIRVLGYLILVTIVSGLMFGSGIGLLYLVYQAEQFLNRHYMPWLDSFLLTCLKGAILLSGTWLGSIMIWRGVKPQLARMRDRRRIANLVPGSLHSRAQIAQTLASLESEAGRLQLVKALGLRARQDGWKPAGEWQDNRIPSYRDAASSELARLEEHWLGLDR